MATITMIPVVCACVVVVVVRDPHVDDDVGDDLPMAAVGGLCVCVLVFDLVFLCFAPSLCRASERKSRDGTDGMCDCRQKCQGETQGEMFEMN